MRVKAWHPGDDTFPPQFVKVFALIPNDYGEITGISFSGEVYPSENHPNIKKKVQRRTRTAWSIKALGIKLSWDPKQREVQKEEPLDEVERGQREAADA